ncbi:Imm26 family immunity protein [Pedobacter frigiditerrae]|uniref:Imm26 family immunity protein n=1 Tax=Pedobacter frigiditerrae TaxID=2530452 RepID=UPI00292EDDF1|nr:Imm26 family immunity protein [Pedobacter frigiditerrae]
MKNKTFKAGDIFAIQIEQSSNYYFGRILFDVQQQYKNSTETSNYLDWHSNSVLIETYKHIASEPKIDKYDVAIDAVFIPKKELLKQSITVIGNVPVNPTKVSFPETLKNVEHTCFFTVGEFAIKTNLSTAYAYDSIKVFPTSGKMYYIQLATLDFSGRRDLIVDKQDIMDNYFRFSDLRSLPEKRAEIYQSIGEDPNISYYDLALKYGFDLGRFYK